MIGIREFQKCLRLLLLHRLRSFLSTLGILFGVVAVITMLSIGEGAKQESLEHIEQLGMNHIIVRQHVMSEEQRADSLEHRSRGLTWRDVEAFQHQIPGLLHVSPLKIVEGMNVSGASQFTPEILAVSRSFSEIKNLQLSEGRFLCDLDQIERKKSCVLGYEIAKNLGLGGHAGEFIKLDGHFYDIVGVLKSIEWKASKNQTITTRNLDQAIFIPLQMSEEITSSDSFLEELSEIILHFSSSQSMENRTKLIKQILTRLHYGYENYQIVVPRELLEQATLTHHMFNLVLGSIAAISLIVGGIGIMNIMLANVSERIREIGVRRAVGATKEHILRQFLFEALVLTSIGAFLGIILGIIFSMAISEFAGWRTVVTFWSIGVALGMSMVVGVCSGLYPAYEAASIDPIKALRRD